MKIYYERYYCTTNYRCGSRISLYHNDKGNRQGIALTGGIRKLTLVALVIYFFFNNCGGDYISAC